VPDLPEPLPAVYAAVQRVMAEGYGRRGATQGWSVRGWRTPTGSGGDGESGPVVAAALDDLTRVGLVERVPAQSRHGRARRWRIPG
jgi:hypothetical protein